MSEIKYAMIGYYPWEKSGNVFAADSITSKKARETAAEIGLEIYQMFPIGEGGQHFCRRIVDGKTERANSYEFAQRLTQYVEAPKSSP